MVLMEKVVMVRKKLLLFVLATFTIAILSQADQDCEAAETHICFQGLPAVPFQVSGVDYSTI